MLILEKHCWKNIKKIVTSLQIEKICINLNLIKLIIDKFWPNKSSIYF